MKNFVQQGAALTIPAPNALASGDGVMVGLIFGVASGAAETGETVTLQVAGVYDLPKLSANAFALGAAVYWDDAAGVCTSTATDNTKIGVAIAAAGNPSATVRVRLNATF